MIVYITGVSRGIGHALALEYLKENHQVIGIGRSHSITHENFQFLTCDLANWEEVNDLKFDFSKQKEVLLINNAGILGEINIVAKLEKDCSQEVMQVNLIAPIQLSRKFLQACHKKKNKLTIVNISSGAGKNAIASWANYCASKAALDMFSETLQQEEIERGNNTKVFAIAPGVVDTDMQKQIRNVNLEKFSKVEKFKNLKSENLLVSPKNVAAKIRINVACNTLNEVICRLD